jgi:hypothetical protein
MRSAKSSNAAVTHSSLVRAELSSETGYMIRSNSSSTGSNSGSPLVTPFASFTRSTSVSNIVASRYRRTFSPNRTRTRSSSGRWKVSGDIGGVRPRLTLSFPCPYVDESAIAHGGSDGALPRCPAKPDSFEPRSTVCHWPNADVAIGFVPQQFRRWTS